MSKYLPLAALMLAVFAAPASASAPEAVEGCVQLSEAHQGARFGSQYLLVKDGDAHYRVGFGKSCSAIASSSSVSIATGGEPNKLCASGTKVTNKHGSCAVRSVDAIDADTYAQYKRRR